MKLTSLLKDFEAYNNNKKPRILDEIICDCLTMGLRCCDADPDLIFIIFRHCIDIKETDVIWEQGVHEDLWTTEGTRKFPHLSYLEQREMGALKWMTPDKNLTALEQLHSEEFSKYSFYQVLLSLKLCSYYVEEVKERGIEYPEIMDAILISFIRDSLVKVQERLKLEVGIE